MEYISLPVQAALWGFVAGGALLLGAAIGYFFQLSRTISSSIMAFGIGVLISALAFNLMDEAFKIAGITAASLGFVFGVILYGVANAMLAKAGAAGRKQSGTAMAGAGASMAIAIGSLLDGLPESAAIGISLLDGEGVAFVTLLAIFISNVPEGLSSSVGMKAAGKSARYVFSIWGSIALACSISALIGYLVIGGLGPFYIGVAISCAAGAIFVMLIDTMIPEAFNDIHAMSGPIAATGFLFAFAASHIFS